MSITFIQWNIFSISLYYLSHHPVSCEHQHLQYTILTQNTFSWLSFLKTELFPLILVYTSVLNLAWIKHWHFNHVYLFINFIIYWRIMVLSRLWTLTFHTSTSIFTFDSWRLWNWLTSVVLISLYTIVIWNHRIVFYFLCNLQLFPLNSVVL